MVQKGEYNDKSDLVTSLITQLAFVEQTTWSDLSSLIGEKKPRVVNSALWLGAARISCCYGSRVSMR